MYEIDSYHNDFILKYDLKNKTSEKIFLRKIGGIKPIPNPSGNNLMENYLNGDAVARFYMVENRYAFIMFAREHIVEEYLYDLEKMKGYKIKGFADISYSDENYLYYLMFGQNSKDENELPVIRKYKIGLAD